MSDEFDQSQGYYPESITEYIAGAEYYREYASEVAGYIPEADLLEVKRILEGYAADEDSERKLERVQQLTKLKIVEKHREILGYTFDAADVDYVVQIDEALGRDDELFAGIVEAAFDFQRKRLANLGLGERAIRDHMAHVEGVCELSAKGDSDKRSSLGEVLMALHDVSKYASRRGQSEDKIEYLDEVALGLHETASAIVGAEVMVAIFANGEVRDRMMNLMDVSEVEYYRRVAALKRVAAVFIADHGYMEFPYKEARRTPLDALERMYVLFGSQLYLDNHREDEDLFSEEIGENRDRFLRIKRAINEADMIVGETPRSWVKYHNELRESRMEWFYSHESSAGYVATFMPTTFEYYRDAPNELGLRAEVEIEINRGVLVFCILNAVCSGDDIEKVNLKNLIKEGLSPEKVRLIELAFNEAESMNMKFMLGKSGFNRLNMLEQHVQYPFS